ncbi:MAG: hypothetical protein H7Z75_11365 [Ferruginibacter sp.]|nr:hypothetical protein [Cytophagales bacterium]
MAAKPSVFLLVLLLGAAARAQSPDNSPAAPPPDSAKFTRYRVPSFGISGPLGRDQALSPLRYAGVGMLVHWNSLRIKPHLIKQTVVRVGGAALSNQSNGNALSLAQLGFEYNRYYKVKSYRGDRLRLFAGGGGDFFLNLKALSQNVNNAVSYDFALSLRAAGLLQYDFRLLKRKFVLTEELSIPFVGILARPPFSWVVPYDAYEEGGNWTNAFRVVSLGNYRRLQNRLSLDWFPSERKRRWARHTFASNWRLAYEWEFLQINRPNKVQLVTPALLFGRVMRF